MTREQLVNLQARLTTALFEINYLHGAFKNAEDDLQREYDALPQEVQDIYDGHADAMHEIIDVLDDVVEESYRAEVSLTKTHRDLAVVLNNFRL